MAKDSNTVSHVQQDRGDPSLPMLAPTRGFVSGEAESANQLSEAREVLFKFRTISAPSGSSSEDGSERIDALLLSSAVEVIPTYVESFSNGIVHFPIALRTDIGVFSAFKLLFYAGRFFLTSDCRTLTSGCHLSNLSFSRTYYSVQCFLLGGVTSSSCFPCLSFFVFVGK